jgi:hypothetical protein
VIPAIIAAVGRFWPLFSALPGLQAWSNFRMLLVGYFENIDSQRGIPWRCAGSLGLRRFLGIPLQKARPIARR